MSKRRWDGLVKVWRRALHKWDPKEEGTVEAVANFENWDWYAPPPALRRWAHYSKKTNRALLTHVLSQG